MKGFPLKIFTFQAPGIHFPVQHKLSTTVNGNGWASVGFFLFGPYEMLVLVPIGAELWLFPH